MKKLENFFNCLNILKGADFQKAYEDDIYRTGVVGQFNLVFELAWKSLQAVLQMHSMAGAETGSPRDVLKLGYKAGFISDADAWLKMLKERNFSVHIYDEEKIDKLIALIRDSFVPALEDLEDTLKRKAAEVEEDSWDERLGR